MTDKTKKAEEKTQEITLESINKRIDDMVPVLNNIIMYCNTLEKWRNMSFKPAEKKSDDKETEVISDADEKK